MSNRGLIIVTGPIDSGKTSWCRETAADKPDCGGLLLLKVYHHGRRIGYDALRLPASETVPFARLIGQEPPAWTGAERVGPFSISKAGLRAANAWLAEAAARPAQIIVDEVGPLELEGGGLSPGLCTVLASAIRQRLYIVIRSGWVQPVCRRFGISEYDLVDIAAGPEKT